MNITNPPKALIALVALLCITALLITGSIASDAGTGLMGLIVGYAVGNGIAAKSGQSVDPIIGRRWTADQPDRRNANPE